MDYYFEFEHLDFYFKDINKIGSQNKEIKIKLAPWIVMHKYLFIISAIEQLEHLVLKNFEIIST